jgi:hypothetical protein
MTGRQEYDRTKDRQRILGKYMIDYSEDIETLFVNLHYSDSFPIDTKVYEEK